MNASSPRPSRSARRRLIPALLICTVSAVALVLMLYRPVPRSTRVSQSLAAARSLFLRGQYEQAEESACEVLQLAPDHADALILAADCARELHAPQRALDYLVRVREDDPGAFTAAAFQAADLLHFSLHRLGEAEQWYRRVLASDPQQVQANEQLARLLSICGRRDEAIPHVLRLIRAGVETDLIMLLARESGSLVDRELLKLAASADPADANPPIGQAAIAVAEERSRDAIGHLQNAVKCPQSPAAAFAMLGKQLALNHQWREHSVWWTSLPDGARDLPDTWIALALAAEHSGNSRGATRAWWEVMKLRPESRQAAAHLSQLLSAADMRDAAGRCQRWLETLQDLSLIQHRALYSDDERSYEDLVLLVEACHRAGRWWEAIAWGRVARQMEPDDSRIAELEQEWQQQLVLMPLTITRPEFHPANAIDLSQFPVPDVVLTSVDTVPSGDQEQQRFSFREVAADAGLDFVFFNGVDGPATHRMFEFTGGGIAVLDLDRDEYPDVFLTQGTHWPGGQPEPSDSRRFQDALFRNHRGHRFLSVADAGGIEENAFGQGAAVGDVNLDGFPDIYAASTGRNALWISNGDGTFSPAPLPASDGSELWTTSCLIADLNDDGVPDLFDVNYVMAEDVFDRVCRGAGNEVVLCAPHDFDPAPDQIWLGDGTGAFRSGNSAVLVSEDAGNGLGVIAWDESRTGRLTLFVANDETANNLLRPAPRESGLMLADQALAAGVAFNGRGESEACMGIAIADADQNGTMDLLVTNFWHESNTLYLGTESGFFTDGTMRFGLADVSLPYLGFGAQFLDADLDGRPELFVTNGHVEDLGRPDQPYRMPPQFFTPLGGTYQETAPAALGAWFQQHHVGRAAARIDWNADTRDDLIVGHLHEAVALLSNTTERAGQGLSLRLTGSGPGRDAVGTSVRWTAADRTLTTQLVCGDGYQCCNERRLNLGCGDAESVSHLEIHWPSGDILIAGPLPLHGRYTADQHSGRLYRLPE